MKKKYIAPVCEVCAMEVKFSILAESGIKADNDPSDIYLEGDVNRNNGCGSMRGNLRHV